MPARTALSVLGIPGPRHTFLPKAPARMRLLRGKLFSSPMFLGKLAAKPEVISKLTST